MHADSVAPMLALLVSTEGRRRTAQRAPNHRVQWVIATAPEGFPSR